MLVEPRANRPAINARTIQRWFCEKIAERLGIGPAEVNVREPFADYGFGSIDAALLMGDLEDWLGIEIPVTLLWEYPSIAELSQYLAEAINAPV
jgi:acyl carrier protein